MNSSDILLKVIDTYLRAYRIMGYEHDELTPNSDLSFRLVRLRVDMHVLLRPCRELLKLRKRKKELESTIEWVTGSYEKRTN